MSLVNDLLIEAERRRSGHGQPRTTRLEDLVPTRPHRTASRGERRAQLALFGVAAMAGLVVGAAAYLGSVAQPFERAPARTSPGTPPVAARRDAAPAPALAASTPTITPETTATTETPGTTVERPVRIESISLERWPGTTRLRIVADGRAAHSLEHDPVSGRLELVLANAALTEPTASIDLLDTPIRALDLRAETPDLRLVLDLDADVHTQTRWLALEHGAALVLDLQTAPTSRPVESRRLGGPAPVGAAPVEIRSGNNALDELDPADAAPKETASAGTALDAAPAALAPIEDEAMPDVEALMDAYATEEADRVYSPSLGDPAAMRIEPSQRERVREERAARRAKREGLLASARRARKAGRLEDADAQYAEIVLLAPNDPTPIAEWSEVLVEQGRIPDALALIDSARERSPRDQTLLIAKARLLEGTGDVAAAVELLDGSGLALTEAPDVHALAAAYQQRAGHHDAAIERYEQILRRFPEEPRGWLGLGVSLEAIGRKREARDVYRIALTVGELPGGARRWVSGRLAALGEEG